MPDKTEKSAAPKVIKWTEEEWASVANHLFDQKGDVLLSSPRLEEIRAKDVFLAQEALPEDRHRKLISIAQGFQGIRDRLSTIFQHMNHAQQGLKNGTLSADAQAGAPEDEPADRSAQSEDLQRAGAGAENGGEPAGVQQALPVDEPQPAAAPAAAAAVADAPAMPAAETAAPMPPGPARTEQAQREPAQPRRQEANGGAQQPPRERNKDRDRMNEGRQQNQSQQAAPASPASASFLEVARPFVAMVCEEMALALVKVLTAKGGEQQLGNLVQKAIAQLGPQQGAGASRSERQNQPRQERAAQAQSFSNVIDTPERTMPIDAIDDDGNHPAEVQPLFDPKLPPSANSDFKPTIGLVGSNLRELDDLQLLYPQLRLTVVAPDAVRSADVFRQCQRIIGLREDVAQPVDELLRRLLRNRYIRIAGGIPRVREQLNAWLHNPNSINAEPRPHVPRGPKGPNQGQGEGGGKKRHNRHLRSPR